LYTRKLLACISLQSSLLLLVLVVSPLSSYPRLHTTGTYPSPSRGCDYTLADEKKCLLVLCGKESSLLVLVMSLLCSYPRIHTAQYSSSPLRCHRPALIVVVHAQLHSCSCRHCLLAFSPSSCSCHPCLLALSLSTPPRSHKPALPGNVMVQTPPEEQNDRPSLGQSCSRSRVSGFSLSLLLCRIELKDERWE
jgi:hypothetical protein